MSRRKITRRRPDARLPALNAFYTLEQTLTAQLFGCTTEASNAKRLLNELRTTTLQNAQKNCKRKNKRRSEDA